ncbi:MAG: fibronectin type III domain-containing protein [Elusimicrobiota bacterium]
MYRIPRLLSIAISLLVLPVILYSAGVTPGTVITNGGDSGTIGMVDTPGDTIVTWHSSPNGISPLPVSVTVTTGYAMIWVSTPASQQNLMPGATVYYPYQIRNYANGSDSFTVAVATIAGQNWQHRIYADDNQDGTHQENETTISSTGLLLPDTTYYFIVGVNVSTSATSGQTSTFRLTVKNQNGQGTEDNWHSAGNDTLTHEIVSTVGLLPPATPSNFYATSVTVSSITWTWTDNATNEDGYRLSVIGVGIQELPANTISTTTTNLTPNTSYSAYVESWNISGSSASVTVSTYTLANPPSGTQITQITTNTITLMWSNNSNPNYTSYGVYRSTNGSSFSLLDSGVFTSYLSSNLSPLTSYWYKVQAINENGIATAFDITVSTRTKSADTTPPKPPCGVRGELIAEQLAKIIWSEVTKNTDGTTCTDLAKYKIYYSNILEGPWKVATDVPSSSTFYLLPSTFSFNYYKITAVDTSDNESADSVYIDNTAALSAVTKENGKIVAFVKIPQDVSAVLYKDGKYTDDIVINMQKLQDDDERDIYVYDFQPQKSTTGEKIDDFRFVQQKIEITFFYDLNNDDYIEKVGLPISEAKSWLSIFYHNGVEWEKLGGVVNANEKSITAKVTHLSKYKLRKTLRTIGFGDLRMYPKKIFAPYETNDTYNRMKFCFENDSEKRVTLRIFDIKGREIFSDSTTDTEIYWYGKDTDDKVVSGGVYIYQLECDKKVINGTVVVVK